MRRKLDRLLFELKFPTPEIPKKTLYEKSRRFKTSRLSKSQSFILIEHEGLLIKCFILSIVLYNALHEICFGFNFVIRNFGNVSTSYQTPPKMIPTKNSPQKFALLFRFRSFRACARKKDRLFMWYGVNNRKTHFRHFHLHFLCDCRISDLYIDCYCYCDFHLAIVS